MDNTFTIHKTWTSCYVKSEKRMLDAVLYTKVMKITLTKDNKIISICKLISLTQENTSGIVEYDFIMLNKEEYKVYYKRTTQERLVGYYN